jgi:putative endonuclease
LAFYTYILASQPNGTLYTGHTDALAKRVWQHKEKVLPGFTAK